jgi:hypothetical protein
VIKSAKKSSKTDFGAGVAEAKLEAALKKYGWDPDDMDAHQARIVMCEAAHGPPPADGYYTVASICGNDNCLSPLHLHWVESMKALSERAGVPELKLRAALKKYPWSEDDLNDILKVRTVVCLAAHGAPSFASDACYTVACTCGDDDCVRATHLQWELLPKKGKRFS